MVTMIHCFRSSISCKRDLISGFRDTSRSHRLSQTTVESLLDSLSPVVPGDFGLESVVDRDAASVVQLDAYRIQTQVLGERSSADTDQQHVARQSLVLPSSRRLHSGAQTRRHTESRLAAIIQKRL